MRMQIRAVACFLVVLLLGGREGVEARSTFIARFSSAGIAGPGIEQNATLYLHYFPGDGEAIVRAEMSYDLDLVNIDTVRSALGMVSSIQPVLRIDYGEHPLARESIDTLHVVLQAREGDTTTRWRGEIYSSLDARGKAAHSTVFDLAVRPPLHVEVRVYPRLLFPGEEVEFSAVVYNADERGRSVEDVIWEWPSGLELTGESTRARAPVALAPGQCDTLHWMVHITRSEPGALRLGGKVRAGDVEGSPLPELWLQLASVPRVHLSLADKWLEVGQKGSFVYEWHNEADEPIEVDALRVEIPPAFAEVEVGAGGQASVVLPEGDEKGYILVEDVGELSPGQKVGLEIGVRALRPGPFEWEGAFLPSGREDFVPLEGEVLVRVVRPESGAGTAGKTLGYPTDLEMVSAAFRAALARAFENLPLRPGAQIYLSPEEKGDKNWVVDDMLTQTLMRLGYQIVLRKPADEEEDAGILYYRLAASLVVYTPMKKRWILLGSQQQREARGDLFLRLESAAGQVEWTRRVRAYSPDRVPTKLKDLLSSSGLVGRTELPVEHKLLEYGLSAGIIGTLVFIFFAP